MPAALVRMSVAERERYVRWWIEESGLSLVQLREVAGAMWGGQGLSDFRRNDARRRENRRTREG